MFCFSREGYHLVSDENHAILSTERDTFPELILALISLLKFSADCCFSRPATARLRSAITTAAEPEISFILYNKQLMLQVYIYYLVLFTANCYSRQIITDNRKFVTHR